MFKLFDMEEENKFSWESLGNIEKGRKNMGINMPVYIYRLFQFTIKNELIRQFGNEKTIEIFRNAGKIAGIEFANNILNINLPTDEFLAHLQTSLEENSLGILRIEKFDLVTGSIIFTVSEDVDCSGLPVTGDTVCNYDEGFLAGILEAYTKREYDVLEIDCWATGSRVCRFIGNVRLKNEE